MQASVQLDVPISSLGRFSIKLPVLGAHSALLCRPRK
jgi:hypothetical protein